MYLISFSILSNFMYRVGRYVIIRSYGSCCMSLPFSVDVFVLFIVKVFYLIYSGHRKGSRCLILDVSLHKYNQSEKKVKSSNNKNQLVGIAAKKSWCWIFFYTFFYVDFYKMVRCPIQDVINKI